MKKYISIFTILISLVGQADSRTFLNIKYSQYDSWRTQSNNRLQVIVSTQPEFCYACKLYEPVLEEASYYFKEVDFVINSVSNLLESPGYVPWTYIYTNNPECRDEVRGYVQIDELKKAIIRALICDKLTR